MSEVIPFDGAKLPAAFAGFNAGTTKDDLSAGVVAGFPILTYRGKVWRVKSKGVDTPITDQEGNPVPALGLILVDASPHLSKTFYKGAYGEGDTAAPDCASLDGIKPDAGVPSPQCGTCAVCPQNIWGSKITPQGTKTKACADNRRVAVVPADDITNERFGGPMMLRIPPASLAPLAAYGDRMSAAGWPYYGVTTRIGFEMDAAYPKLTFKEVRPLNEAEAAQVMALRQDNDQIARILRESTDTSVSGGQPEAAQPVAAFEQPAVPAQAEAPVQSAAAAASAEPVQPQPKEPDAPAAVVAEPEPQPKPPTPATNAEPTADEVPVELDNMLGDLLNS